METALTFLLYAAGAYLLIPFAVGLLAALVFGVIWLGDNRGWF